MRDATALEIDDYIQLYKDVAALEEIVSLSLMPIKTYDRTARIEHDFYPTEAALVRELRSRVAIAGKILEPCAGDGAIATQFGDCDCKTNEPYPQESYPVDWQMDATDKTFWKGLKKGDHEFDWIVTNPPFRQATPILTEAISAAKVGVAFLLRLTYLEPVRDRAELLKSNSMNRLIIFNPRPKFRPDKRGTDSATVAWFVWQKNAEGQQIEFVTDWRESA